MSIRDFKYNDDFMVTNDMKMCFNEHGYIMVRNLLSEQELDKLKNSLETSADVTTHSQQVDDGDNRFARLTLWSHPGDDVTGMISRSEKVVGTCEELLGGEVYHYHAKVMMKLAKVGGRHAWHQDYGYWYRNTALFPDMMTVFIAVDRCHKGNGCLEILDGSQKCGRIEHNFVGELVGADMERVNMIEKVCPKKNVEMNPGDALFFHCNLLHYSGPNLSEERRWAFLIAYNKATNDPVEEHHHPKYTPLHKVRNSAILDCDVLWDASGKELLTKEKRQNSDLKEINLKSDALFIQCNLLHYSGPNLSEERRWAFLIAYNKATNDPAKEHHLPNYTPLVKVPNSAIVSCPVEWDVNKIVMSKENLTDLANANWKR